VLLKIRSTNTVTCFLSRFPIHVLLHFDQAAPLQTTWFGRSWHVRLRTSPYEPGNEQPRQRSQYHAHSMNEWSVPTHDLHADIFNLEVTGCLTGRRCMFLVQRRGSGMLTKGKAEPGAGRGSLCHRRHIICFRNCTRECSRPVSTSRGSLMRGVHW
jgi:hypothetical protein